MKLIEVRSDANRQAGVRTAAQAVKRGEVIVIPTDTVYGIGADAFNPEAVAAVLAAKGRGPAMPPPVLVPNARTLDGLATGLSSVAQDLMAAFWPGPLTLVCTAQPSLAWNLGDLTGTFAVRMPLHRVALSLLELTGPMAVTSANLTGQPPATTVEQASAQLGSAVQLYLDAGPSGSTLASSIVDVTGRTPVLLREGALTLAELQRVAPQLSPGLDSSGGAPTPQPSDPHPTDSP